MGRAPEQVLRVRQRPSMVARDRPGPADSARLCPEFVPSVHLSVPAAAQSAHAAWNGHPTSIQRSGGHLGDGAGGRPPRALTWCPHRTPRSAGSRLQPNRNPAAIWKRSRCASTSLGPQPPSVMAAADFTGFVDHASLHAAPRIPPRSALTSVKIRATHRSSDAIQVSRQRSASWWMWPMSARRVSSLGSSLVRRLSQNADLGAPATGYWPGLTLVLTASGPILRSARQLVARGPRAR